MKKLKEILFVLVITTPIQSYAAIESNVEKTELSAQSTDSVRKHVDDYQHKIIVLEKKLEQMEEANEEAQDKLEQLAIQTSQQSNIKRANTFNPSINMILNGRFLDAPDNF